MITDDLIEYYSNVKDDEFTMSQITRKLALELKSTRAKLEIARKALREISEWGGPVAGYGLMELAEEALEKIK